MEYLDFGSVLSSLLPNSIISHYEKVIDCLFYIIVSMQINSHACVMETDGPVLEKKARNKAKKFKNNLADNNPQFLFKENVIFYG